MTRDLYNVYSNGTFTGLEERRVRLPGCDPRDHQLRERDRLPLQAADHAERREASIDPSTGVWYRTEIANVIKSQGFIPFPLQARENQGRWIAGAAAVLAAHGDKLYLRNDPVVGSTVASNETKSNPSGYCEVWTTDQNSAPS